MVRTRGEKGISFVIIKMYVKLLTYQIFRKLIINNKRIM